MHPTLTLTNAAYPGQVFVLLSSNNGVYRLWNEEGNPGQQELLLGSLAGWKATASNPFDDPFVGGS